MKWMAVMSMVKMTLYLRIAFAHDNVEGIQKDVIDGYKTTGIQLPSLRKFYANPS